MHYRYHASYPKSKNSLLSHKHSDHHTHFINHSHISRKLLTKQTTSTKEPLLKHPQNPHPRKNSPKKKNHSDPPLHTESRLMQREIHSRVCLRLAIAFRSYRDSRERFTCASTRATTGGTERIPERTHMRARARETEKGEVIRSRERASRVAKTRIITCMHTRVQRR